MLFDRPDATVVCLQYGDVSQEVDEAARWGRPLWRPPDLDLQNDIEGVAALMMALDAVAGPPERRHDPGRRRGRSDVAW